MYNSNMFADCPEGFRMATDCMEDRKLITLTIAQAFGDYKYPVPATDMSVSAYTRLFYGAGEAWVDNTLKYGNILTNDDYSAVMLAVPFEKATTLPYHELAKELATYATQKDADDYCAIYDYTYEDEATLDIREGSIYLEVLAVQTPRQGKKEASRLVHKLFEECDKEDRDVWLLTNTEKNEAIYKHFGFDTILYHYVEELDSAAYFMCRPAHRPY